MPNTKLIAGISKSLRGCRWRLIVTDLYYKFLAFIILTPLFSVMFRGLLYMRGNAVLSDVDIALFFAGPVGFFCASVLGAIWLGILALEQASLLAILAANSVGKRLHMLDSLFFASGHAFSVLRVTGRLTVYSILVMAPFLAVVLWVYGSMLAEYDINFYLNERPSEFKIAVGIGIALGVALVAVLTRLYAGWFLALPLVLFDRVAPKSALAGSRKIVAGHRHRIVIWILAWLLVLFTLNTAATLVIGGAGRLLIPSNVRSIAILSSRVGLMLSLLTIVGMAINILGAIGFAAISYHGYLKLHPGATTAIGQTNFAAGDRANRPWRLTRTRILAASLIGGLSAALLGLTAINSLRIEDHVKVMAHRGASKAAPENTLAAVHQAIDDGADWVEIDVQETSDGEVVVIHDSDLMKLAGNNLKIWNSTLPELQSVDIGSWFDAKFAKERVPALAEVLKLCQGKIGVMIELKYYGHDEQLEKRVVEIVERFNMAKHIMIMSLKPEGVKKMKGLRPQWKCGILMSVSVGNIKRIPADFLAVNAKFATRSLVNRSHQAGKEIFVWTVDDAASMSKMINRGVDGLLTNRPELAREVLAQRATMSSAERLLAEVCTLLGVVQERGEP